MIFKPASLRRAALLLLFLLAAAVPAAYHADPAAAQASPSFYCNNVSTIPLDECRALRSLYSGLSGGDWIDNTGWLSNPDPCTWNGVNCQMMLGKVSDIILSGNNLKGEIPEQFSGLSLNWLDLSDNQISGPLPYSLWQSDIAQLMLADNQISGYLPLDVGQLGSSVQVIDISRNQFIGPLPAQLGQLSSLSILKVNGNQFQGPLPMALTAIPSLYMFDFSDTQLCEPEDDAFQAWLSAIPNLTSSGIRCGDAEQSPAQFQIAYVDGGDIYLHTEGVPENTRLTESGLDCCLSWSHQGDRLFFVRDPQGAGQMMVYDFTSGTESPLGPAGYRVSSRTAPTTDGRRLVYTRNMELEEFQLIGNRSCLEWLDLEGGGTVNINCKDEVFLGSPMVMDEASVMVTEAGFEFAQLLTFQLIPGSDGRPAGCCGQPTLFPDSRSMAVIANSYLQRGLFTDGTSSGIFRLPLYGGDPSPIIKAAELIYDPDISADGSRMLFTRRLESGDEQVEILTLSTGESQILFPGSGAVWGPPAPELAPLDSALLQEKRGLITALSSTAYAGRYGAAAAGFPAYDEAGSLALVEQLEEQSAGVAAQQAAAFGRLVLQERALSATLEEYELLRDDFADSLVDLASMAVGSAFFATVADDGDLAAALADQTAALVEDSLLLGLAAIDDPELRQAAETTVAALFDMLETAALDPAHFADLIVGETLREEAAARLTAYLVDRVQPDINQGVRSVAMEAEPRWQVSGTELLAATQTDAVATISRNDSQRVRGQYEDIVQGLALNELLTDIGDLATQGGVPFAPVASITGRVLNVILNVSSMWMLADSMDCVVAVSRLAGEMAFEPPEKLLLNCDDPRITGTDQAAPHPPAWLGRDSWQQSMYPRLDAAASSLLDAAAGSGWSFAALQDDQRELSAAGHQALLSLLPPAGSRLTPEMAAAADDLLRLQGESVNLLAAAAALERSPGDDAAAAQFTLAREEMALRLSAVEAAADQLPPAAAGAFPMLLLGDVPARLAQVPGQPTTIPLTVHNAGSGPSSQAVLTSRVGETQLGRYAVPQTAAGASTQVAISLPPMELGRYLVTISVEESGRRDFQYLRLLVADEPIEAPAPQEPALTDAADGAQPEQESAMPEEAPASGRSLIYGLLFALFSLLTAAAVVWALRGRSGG